MRRCDRTGVSVIGTLWLLFLASPVWAATTTTTPFRGVTLHQRTETSPRPLKINVIEINLADPDIRFRVTPPNGSAAGETTLQTTRTFLAQENAQMAINASFFGFVSPNGADNVGLTASDGTAYSPFSSGFEALNISSANVATIVKQKELDITGYAPDPNVPIYNAVSGNERIIRNGVNQAVDTVLHPRTAAGVASGNRLILMTVDGRQPGVSEGVTTPELANLLLGYGVIDALNLDGGGSTTMAIADTTPRLLNVPVGISNVPGTERTVGANLALYAAAIPEPATGVIFACSSILVLMGRSRRV